MVPSTAPALRFTGHFPLAPGNQINIWYGISCWGTGQGKGGELAREAGVTGGLGLTGDV